MKNYLILHKDKTLSLDLNEKIYVGDNNITKIYVKLPSVINEFNMSQCTVELRAVFPQINQYISYDIDTTKEENEFLISDELTISSQTINLIMIIRHDDTVIGQTNAEKFKVLASGTGDKEITPREEWEQRIRELENQIENKDSEIHNLNRNIGYLNQTIEQKNEEITNKSTRIEELNHNIDALETENSEQAQTITRQNTTIDELNHRRPPLQQLDPINPSDIQQTYDPESPNIGFPQVIVNPVTAEGLNFDFDNLKEGVPFLEGVGTYNPFPEGSQGGIYIIEQTSQGYPIKILVKNYSRPFSPFAKFYDNSASGRGALQEFKFEDCENITELAAGYFWGCDSLTTVILPTSLKRILNNTFEGCSSLQRIELPNGLQRIETGYTFQQCRALRYVFLPNTLEYVADSCFFQLYDLVDIQLENGFNCSINLSHSNKYPVETLVAMLEALADRTGETAYTLTIGTTNKNKLTAEQKAIATNKNWNLN